MSASFAPARAAARAACAAQDYPQGVLYVVATPIGNLADISLRALHVLGLADCIACEDTRHTQALLRALGIERPAGGLLALHQHNEQEAAVQVVERLARGQRVAYCSDAGTPALSDPGARLVAAVRAAGYRVLPLPGASSLTALLSAAGAVGDGDAASAFVFAGFAAGKAQALAAQVQAFAAEPRAVILLDAPHRIQALAGALAVLGARPVTVGRELTKQFEEIATLACEGMAAWLAADAGRLRGEFALLLHPQRAARPPDDGVRVLTLLLAQLPLKTAVHVAAQITGAPKNALYETALALQRQPVGDD